MKFASKTLAGVGGLIGLYLVVYYSTGAGRVLREGAAGSRDIIKTLQGR